MNTERTSSTRSKGWVYGILGALALVIIGLSCWLISLKGDLSTLENEKEQQRADFQAEVDSLLRVHNELKENYGELSSQLAEKDSIIQADAEEIKKLLDSQWDYNRIKKKVAELQKISQKYVNQLDSLYVVNQELVAENERIREEVQEERKQNKNLQRLKEELTNKVNQAAVLRIYNLNAEAVRFKGGNQETVTDKARRAERIRIDFTVGQNELVEAGSKDFYLRIADPSKSIISKGMGDEYAFTYQGELLQYTEKIHFTYDNKEKDIRAYYIKPSDKEMQPGYYFIDIYDGNDNLIGQTSLNLR
jgi:DNA repair exonuclease SbcCD ATPase subunit